MRACQEDCRYREAARWRLWQVVVQGYAPSSLPCSLTRRIRRRNNPYQAQSIMESRAGEFCYLAQDGSIKELQRAFKPRRAFFLSSRSLPGGHSSLLTKWLQAQSRRPPALRRLAMGCYAQPSRGVAALVAAIADRAIGRNRRKLLMLDQYRFAVGLLHRVPPPR
jgi:hypothetical protein